MKQLATYLILLLATFAFNACSNSDKDGDTPISEWRYDFVTYKGYSNGVATWEYLGRGDSAAITLQATMNEPEKITKNQRMLLYYSVIDSPSQNVRNVKVSYVTYSNVASDSLRVSVKDVSSYSQHPIRLRSIWRTGEYINMRCEVEYTGKTRMFYLMADRNTIDDDTIHCYLVHDLMEADTTYFWRNSYGSFCVGAALKRANCRTLRVHINDEIYPEVKYYDFNK